MSRITFLLSKHPYGPSDGESRLSRVLLEAAASSHEVRAIALAGAGEVGAEGASHGAVTVTTVPKPPLSLPRVGLSSLRRGRSMIHTRFSTPELIEAVGAEDADLLVARRVYMAQAAIDAGRVPPAQALAVIVDTLESQAMESRGPVSRRLLGIEARRTWGDERRCIRAASAVSAMSDIEMARARDAGVEPVGRLDFALPPAPKRAPLSEATAFFVGDRMWPPNRDAHERLMALWPRIAARASGARLVVAGRPARGEAAPAEPGVETTGYVPDLDTLWRSAGVLLAPVAFGGGVRVKVLDAARHGVPVVGTEAALGSAPDYLPVRPCGSEEEFVEAAAALLADGDRRATAGRELYEANRELHDGGFVERQVETLIAAGLAGGADSAGS